MAIIKIDYDQKINNIDNFILEFEARCRFLNRLYQVPLFVNKVSAWETKKGFHFYIDLHKKGGFTDTEILYIQILLFSDIFREGFNMVRISEGNVGPERWNILFIDKEHKTSASKSLEVVLKLKLDSIFRQ